MTESATLGKRARTGLRPHPQLTPMQWSSGPNAGFTTAEARLPIGSKPSCNVEAQEQDRLYERLLRFRLTQRTLARPESTPTRRVSGTNPICDRRIGPDGLASAEREQENLILSFADGLRQTCELHGFVASVLVYLPTAGMPMNGMQIRRKEPG